MSNYPPETHQGTVTSWVPIASAFPSSKGCETLLWSVVASTIAGWDPGYGVYVDPKVHCVPPAVTSWWDQDKLGGNSLTKLSVGPITCPDGYKTATTAIENESSTFVQCCPPNYTYVSLVTVGGTGQCSSMIPAGNNVTYASYTSGSWKTFTTTYASATPAWGIQINGYNIAQAGATGTTSAPTSSSTSSGTGTPKPPSQTSSGLSTGAKAGIGIGVALVAIALGALIVWFLARRKTSRSQDYAVTAPPPTDLAYEQNRYHEAGYTDQVPPTELSSKHYAGMTELAGSGVPIAELQASTPVDRLTKR